MPIEYEVTPYFVEVFCGPEMHKKETVTNNGYDDNDDTVYVCSKHFVLNACLQVGSNVAVMLTQRIYI